MKIFQSKLSLCVHKQREPPGRSNKQTKSTNNRQTDRVLTVVDILRLVLVYLLLSHICLVFSVSYRCMLSPDAIVLVAMDALINIRLTVQGADKVRKRISEMGIVLTNQAK